jgi:hypothetical protein
MLSQADTTVGKNVIIGEPRETPKDQKASGQKVVIENDEDGKNKLKIIARSTRYLSKKRQFETTGYRWR